MTQAKKNYTPATVIVCTVILALLGCYGFANIEAPATAAEIAAEINFTVPAVVDNSDILDDILDQVDTRTDVSGSDARKAKAYAADEMNSRDFKELLEDILDIDEDDFRVIDKDVKDTEVTTASEDDNEDGNFKVEKFYRVEYKDVDADDSDVIYVILTADIIDLDDDENDKEVEFTMSETDRSFKFD